MIDRSHITGPFLISAGALVLAGAALVAGGYAFVRTVVASTGGDADPDKLVAAWLERHEERMDLYSTRFNERSVFYTPSPTPRPLDPVPPVVIKDEPPVIEPPEPREPPPPPDYNGPELLAILGDEIWIRGSGSTNSIVRVKVGEQREGVELLGTSPPWTAHVGWSRGTYDVPLFETGVPGISEEVPASTTASVAGIINEGDIDPATLTTGITINPTGVPASSLPDSSRFRGRNVARPANMTERSGESVRGRRGRGNRGEIDEDGRARREEFRRNEEEAKREAVERARREKEQRTDDD